MKKKLDMWKEALFCVAALCIVGCTKESQEVIAWVNGLPVEKEEAALFAEDADDPDALKEAVEKIAWDKYLQGEMVRTGELSNTSYGYFLEQLDQENQERKRKEAAGEVIYGPRQYSEKVYYDFRMEQFEKKWADGVEVSVDEAVLRDWYEADESLYQRFGEVTLQYLSFMEGETEEEVSRLREQIAEKVADGEGFADAAKEAGCTLTVEERKFAQEDLSLPDVTAYPEISEIVHGLSEGEVSEPVWLTGQSLIFYCSSREAAGRVPFEECKDALKELYREEQVKKQKQEICDGLEIRFAEGF